jgi:hypothetical protein
MWAEDKRLVVHSFREREGIPSKSKRRAFLRQTLILSPPSNAPSEVTTDDPNRVSIPKPDIVLGLSHTSFSQLQGKIL